MAGPTVDGAGAVAFSSDASCLTSSTSTTANLSASVSHWRPQSARSARTASPLFPWVKRSQQHSDPFQPGRQHLDVTAPAPGESFGGPAAERKISSSHGRPTPKRKTHSRGGSTQKRQSQAGLPQPLTREEFEALPMAIQRKYFSTLERLRFAQDSESAAVDGISQHYNDISSQHFKRRKSSQDRDCSRTTSAHAHGQPCSSSWGESHLPSPHSPLAVPSTSLPERFRSREQQLVLARQLRASVILDAADEAIYKIGRRASRHLPDADLLTPSLSSRWTSMDAHETARPPRDLDQDQDQHMGKHGSESFYDSFRWLEEEEDLDLRLSLDDYHANLREELPSPTKERRPSFRRHLSITKIPFGRPSVSSSRPGTKDATTPASPTQSTMGSPFGHARRKSRALSLIAPKQPAQDSIAATFDPAAAHYQDPEARLKLRVYLASPQKFDEAIEFGFPSKDVLSAPPVINSKGIDALHRRQSRQRLSENINLCTFLADDDDDDDDDDDELSANSEQPSMADPESPRTPQTAEPQPGVRPLRVSTDPCLAQQPAGRDRASEGGYAQMPASSREMTLRMTLTRPDLRAGDDQIYGWQNKAGQAPRKSTSTPWLSEFTTNVSYVREGAQKESMEKIFASMDHANANSGDGGVMKRLWNRVRRS